MTTMVAPQPVMEDQRFFPARSNVASVPYIGKAVKIWIDPTCGRYCLKSLLKWHKRVNTGFQPVDYAVGYQRGPQPNWTTGQDVQDFTGYHGLDYAASYFLYLASNWISYDPVVNFPDAERLLKTSAKPTKPEDWAERLANRGPIILTGILGAASVPHVILLVGVDDTDAGNFYYLDPLKGAPLQQESYASMYPKIDDYIVYGRKRIREQM